MEHLFTHTQTRRTIYAANTWTGGCCLAVIDAAAACLPFCWQTLAGQKTVVWQSRALQVVLSWSGQPLGSWGQPPGLTWDKTQHHFSTLVSLLTLEPGLNPAPVSLMTRTLTSAELPKDSACNWIWKHQGLWSHWTVKMFFSLRSYSVIKLYYNMLIALSK